MTIRMRHVPAMVAVLAAAGCGGGTDELREDLADLISPGQGSVDRAMSFSDALAPLEPGDTPPALPEITLERAADGTVSMTVARGVSGPAFAAGESEPLDDVWTRAEAEARLTGSVEHVAVYTDIQTPGLAPGGVRQVPDGDYLYLGWWLSVPEDLDDGYAFRAFAEGTEPFTPGLKFTPGDAAALDGEAVYRGVAAGAFATIDFTGGTQSGGDTGTFTAEAELTASFGGGSVAVDDHFSIVGSLTDFRDVEEDDPLDDWSVTLEKIDLVAGSSFFGSGATAATLGDSTGEGSWKGVFFGDGRADGQPGSVAGTFDATLTAARISGAFGARNTAADE